MPRPQTARKRLVYYFGDGRAEGNASQKDLLGGKGANLAEMCRLGMPVPAGFTITTEVCRAYFEEGQRYPARLWKDVRAALARIERSTGKSFGSGPNPLLVSVRSGARVSMPGMMDTVLNLGLNDKTVAALAERSGNPRFAWDVYRRFVQMYADVVLGLKAANETDDDPFSAARAALKRKRRIHEDHQLDARDLEQLVATYKRIVRQKTGSAFPEDPWRQLQRAIGAVFESWNSARAIAYRTMNHIPADWGTACNVVAMVFGNLGTDSGTGVAFTRDPATGERRFYGEYLANAQGEDVVAGLRTPEPMDVLAKLQPRAWKELNTIRERLERHYRDMQDLEFTIEHGRLYMLQCRSGKRTGMAAVRIAADMVREGLIDQRTAVLRVPPEALDQLLQPVFAQKELDKARKERRRLGKGLAAGPGAATGRIAFTASAAQQRRARGESVVLVRIETSPEDILGMQASAGILTARGGMTSHAALVARQMGKVCVVGAGELEIDYRAGTLVCGGTKLSEGDWLSVDGSTGEIYAGAIATQPSEVARWVFAKKRGKPKKGSLAYDYDRLLAWADGYRRLRVRANADQPDQCVKAIAFGAEGVGLCRTEHMFFAPEKIDAVREMIVSETEAQRVKALARLLPLQRADFEGIFAAMGPRPVTIRSLDPPLHEFLPHDEATVARLAREMKIPRKRLETKIESLREMNPMLGHRGCRLGISYPEITRMQARAIFEAACNVARTKRFVPRVEIMIPLVSTKSELVLQGGIVRSVAEQVFKEKKRRIPYLVGTMIELPRAALRAGTIAESAEFFSFGTNDLTQTTYGISRDDGARFLPMYIEEDIYPEDPFATLDELGVGRLMEIAVAEGRKQKPGLKMGICGEHGGDPRSIEFCHTLELDYVSCSPFRVPLARLAAAQAALRATKK